MIKTRVQDLANIGQSVWLDSISRTIIRSGRLDDMIRKGLRGIISNPAIFERAIRATGDYDQQMAELAEKGRTVLEIYDDLTTADIRGAADKVRLIYEQTNRRDGYVSLEINPKVAYNTEETIKEAKRLHKKVRRPNVMFKVPATKEGLSAVEELISEGVNVNITLVFSPQQYEKSALAYIDGLRKGLDKGIDITRVYSVVSVFVSRIDTEVDKLLDKKMEGQDFEKQNEILFLRGMTAVANSKIIYRQYRHLFSSVEFEELRKKGANRQRVLWGSTSTKDPAYIDVKYVNELIAPDTINTMPEKTFYAFLDHGIAEESILKDIDSAEAVFDNLFELGININDIYDRLLLKGLEAFDKSFEALLQCIKEKVRKIEFVTVQV